MNKPVFTYKPTIMVIDERGYTGFDLYRGREFIVNFPDDTVTPSFMDWLVNTMNENYDSFAERLIKEMGF